MKLNTLTKYCLTSIALAVAIPVFAGPMPMAEKNVTPMAPSCDWTGLYIGVNAGVTEFKSDFTDVNDWENRATSSYEKPAFIGGGQIGYNYQWQDLVIGIEADFSGLAGAKNGTFRYNGEEAGHGEDGFENEGFDDYAKVDFMATLRGRIGISLLDNKALLYFTAGGAYAHGKWDDYYHYYDELLNEADWRGDDWRWGWVGGFGFEYAFNCHWSFRAEGLYTWLEDDTTGINGPDGSRYVAGGSRYPNSWNVRFNDELFSYRVGINYKFTGFLGAH